MMPCLICDFETRSFSDLKTVGAWAYAQHPSTDVLCVGLRDSKTGAITALNSLELMFDNPLRKAVEDPEYTIVAHNVMFEYAVYHCVLVKRLGYPAVPISRWDCTLARSLAIGLPRALGMVTKILNLKHQKDAKGAQTMRYMAYPKDGGFKWNPQLQKTLEDYCISDVQAEHEVEGVVRPLQRYERPIWELDQIINARGVKLDVEAIRCVIKLLDEQSAKHKARVKELGNGMFDTANQRDKILTWLKEKNIMTETLRKTDTESIIKCTADKSVKELLEIRLSEMKTSNAKYRKMLEALCNNDHRIRGMFVYHGAGTGRWAGAIVQLQNLPRKSVADIEASLTALKRLDTAGLLAASGQARLTDACSMLIRNMIVAEDGHVFFVGDFAAIEARGIMWLAGEESTLEIFRSGGDLYIDMAMTIYKLRDPKQVTAEQRSLGKAVILGCGYSMSARKFAETCKAWKVNITDELAERAVSAYRNRFKKVVSFWYTLERKAREAISNKSTVEYGRLKLSFRDGTFMIKLPSGRVISYQKMHINANEELQYESYRHGSALPITTYGGRLAENVTQGMCRDLLAEAMLRLEAKGYPVVMHIHDEIVCEVKEGHKSFEEFKRIMAETPAWAAGFPVDVSGGVNYRYMKH